jgi:hypothetical protein
MQLYRRRAACGFDSTGEPQTGNCFPFLFMMLTLPHLQARVTRICEYLATQVIPSDPKSLAADLWTKHGHKVKVEVHPRDLDAEIPDDRRLWQK